MNKIASIRLRALLIGLVISSVGVASHAGSVDELKHEISFLAKKLLDKSGKDNITVKQAAIKKAFIGVCPEPTAKGIHLTCITPGHSAAKAGLQTGDLVVAIDALSMVTNRAEKQWHKGSKKRGHYDAYHQVFDNLKTGETLAFKILRGGKEMTVMVTVGAISHPAYTMTISKDRLESDKD